MSIVKLNQNLQNRLHLLITGQSGNFALDFAQKQKKKNIILTPALNTERN